MCSCCTWVRACCSWHGGLVSLIQERESFSSKEMSPSICRRRKEAHSCGDSLLSMWRRSQIHRHAACSQVFWFQLGSWLNTTAQYRCVTTKRVLDLDFPCQVCTTLLVVTERREGFPVEVMLVMKVAERICVLSSRSTDRVSIKM